MKKIVIGFIVAVIFICAFFSYSYIDMLPLIKDYGKIELERFHQMIVTHSYMTNQSVYDQFLNIERNDHNEIQLIEFDMIKINQLANDVVLDIEATYDAIEKHNYVKKDNSYYEKRIEDVSKNGIVSRVSLSLLLNMPVFYAFLPSVSISYKHLSKVNSSIVKKVENYGLNHIVVEIDIQITMEHSVVYPFFEEMTRHVVDIPILLEIYQGQIPHVYMNQ